MAPHTYQDPIGFYEWFDDLPYAIQDSILKHLPRRSTDTTYALIRNWNTRSFHSRNSSAAK